MFSEKTVVGVALAYDKDENDDSELFIGEVFINYRSSRGSLRSFAVHDSGQWNNGDSGWYVISPGTLLEWNE